MKLIDDRFTLALGCFVIALVTYVCFFAIPANAGSFTVTSTAEQDTVLAQMLVELNAERAAEDPPKPAITVNQMVRGIMNRAFKSYVRSDRVKSHQSLRKSWTDATQTDRDNIRTILGMP